MGGRCALVVARRLPRREGHAALRDVAARRKHAVVAHNRLAAARANGKGVVSIMCYNASVVLKLLLVARKHRVKVPAVPDVEAVLIHN